MILSPSGLETGINLGTKARYFEYGSYLYPLLLFITRR